MFPNYFYAHCVLLLCAFLPILILIELLGILNMMLIAYRKAFLTYSAVNHQLTFKLFSTSQRDIIII